MEAKITENTEIKTKPKVGVKIKDSTKPTKKVKIIEDKTKPHIFEKELPITKEMILRFMSKNGTIKKEIQNLLYENALIKVGDNPKDLLKFFIFFYDKVKNSKK